MLGWSSCQQQLRRQVVSACSAAVVPPSHEPTAPPVAAPIAQPRCTRGLGGHSSLATGPLAHRPCSSKPSTSCWRVSFAKKLMSQKLRSAFFFLTRSKKCYFLDKKQRAREGEELSSSAQLQDVTNRDSLHPPQHLSAEHRCNWSFSCSCEHLPDSLSLTPPQWELGPGSRLSQPFVDTCSLLQQGGAPCTHPSTFSLSRGAGLTTVFGVVPHP